MYLVISASLKSSSRSRALAHRALDCLKQREQSCQLLDLAKIELPLCDGEKCYENPQVQEVAAQVQQAQGILLATPIYNYDMNAAAKNLIELTGKAWQETVVGFLCAAGGRSSYMSIMGIANSLMLDFRSVVVPRFVYATGESYRGAELIDEEVEERIDDLSSELIRMTEALTPE